MCEKEINEILFRCIKKCAYEENSKIAQDTLIKIKQATLKKLKDQLCTREIVIQ